MKKCAAVLCGFLIISGCASSRPWTKSEKVAAGFFLAAHTANYYSTEKVLDNPANWEKENFALGKHPSDRKVALYFSFTGIGALIVAHFWEDARPWLLWGYGGVNLYWVKEDRKLY